MPAGWEGRAGEDGDLLVSESEDLAAEFARSSRRSRKIKLAVIGVIALSPIIWALSTLFRTRHEIAKHEAEYEEQQRLSDAELAELQAAIPAAQKRLDELDRQFAAATAPEKLRQIAETEAPCPVRFRAPDPAAASSYVKNRFQSSETSRVIPVTAPGARADAGLDDLRYRLTNAAEQLVDGKARRRDLEGVQGVQHVGGYQTFVVGIVTPPVVLGDSYDAGTVRGNAYVYAYDRQQVICAAALDVQNSAGVDITYYAHADGLDRERNAREATEATLKRDMEMQLQFAIASHLHAAQIAQ